MSLNKKFIFIVEDDVINRMTYQYLFMSNGAYVEFERYGSGTIQRMKSLWSIDLIILDLMLAEGETGYHIFEEIRKNSQFDTIPIIAVSASERSEAIARCQQMGFNGYIPKPIDLQKFTTRIDRVLAGEQVWAFD